MKNMLVQYPTYLRRLGKGNQTGRLSVSYLQILSCPRLVQALSYYYITTSFASKSSNYPRWLCLHKVHLVQTHYSRLTRAEVISVLSMGDRVSVQILEEGDLEAYKELCSTSTITMLLLYIYIQVDSWSLSISIYL